jgi:hypothetical protein
MTALPTPANAEITALNALAFLAGSEDGLARLVAVSGIAPADIKSRAGDRDFLAGVLDFLLADEPRLLAFCADESMDPRDIHLARHALGGR